MPLAATTVLGIAGIVLSLPAWFYFLRGAVRLYRLIASGKPDPGQVPQQVCRHLVEFLGVVDQHRIESRTAGLCDGGVGQEQARAMNQFGVVEGPVEIGDRQVGLEETPDRLEDRVSQGEFYDVFRVETELPGPGQHLTITRRQGTLVATVAEPGLTETRQAGLAGARILLTDPDFTQFSCEEDQP